MSQFSRYRFAWVLGAGATVLAAGALFAVSLSAQQPATRPAANAAAIARGKYLVTVQDCNGCHTPFNEKGEPDMTKMLMGHPANVSVTAPRPAAGGWLVSINTTNTAWSGPWGVSFTSNLTPDRATGIGAWSEATFIASIRKGMKSGTGRSLLPPMPWRMYANLTDDDLKAVYAYLMSIPAISNRVPNPLPPAPAAGAAR
jgi:mono/diheme cytochrome c family protein